MRLEEELNIIKQSMIKIASLSEIYDELISSRPKKGEAEQKRIEAEYARDQILKLSIHVKHLLQDLERKEVVR
ncbi:hypothetical protein ACFL96_06580 [Thermoproteota archaeon]